MNGDKKEYFAEKCKFPKGFEFAVAVAVGHKNTEKEPHKFDLDKSVSFI